MSNDRFVSLDEITQIHEGEKAMTTEELELAAAALMNEDKPMTAEERREKYPMIPTRVETKTGTWEIIDGYNGDKTLLGYRTKDAHEYGPMRAIAPSIILTVDEWMNVFGQLEEVIGIMKL